MAKKILKAIGIVLAIFFSFIFISKTLPKLGLPDITNPKRGAFPDKPPVTYNLGVNFDTWDRETGMAGDFLFTNKDVTHYNNKIFLENGDFLQGPDTEIIPHPMYILPPGTEIISVTDGTVAAITYQEMHNDYSLVISPNDSSWTIDYDHVTNVRVEKGDIVTVGQVIAEVPLAVGGLRESNLGFTEIMIFKDGGPNGNNPTACLYDLLDDSVKDKFHAQIYQLVSDWERFKNDTTIYDEASWKSPGCIYNEITEGEARKGKSR